MPRLLPDRIGTFVGGNPMTRRQQRRGCEGMLTFAMVIIAVGFSYVSASDSPLVVLPLLGSDRHRTDFVQRTLCDRSNHVVSGRRSDDFGRFVREHADEINVLSMHGVEVAEETTSVRGGSIAKEENRSGKNVAKAHHKAHRRNRNGPFPENCMDLDIHADPSEPWRQVHYKGEVDDWDRKPPSALRLVARAIQLFIHFLPVILTAIIAYFSQSFRVNTWYRMIATALGSSGAAFIKWGQWASTRSDMFPEALCSELEQLHSSAPAHPWEYTEMSVESSLDIPEGSLLDVFASFDVDPIASGSIAQIHKARLPNGDSVVVKVRHPKVAQRIDMDFRLMTKLARIVDKIPSLSWLHLSDSVAQFSHTMAAQAHLQVEAHHLELFNHNFARWNSVRFPRPIYASSKVIMETFEPGKITTDILDIYDSEAKSMGDDIQGYELIPPEVAEFLVTTGVSIYLKMLLADNLMHADLHPGNIMLDVLGVQRDKDSKAIALVDAGMVAELSDDESVNFIGLLISLGEGDGHSAAQFAMRFSQENHLSSEERAAFSKEMAELFKVRCRGYGTNVDVGDVLRGVLGLIRDHRVRIDANYATLVVNVLCIESLARRVCPSYNVLDASRPLLQSYRRLCFEEDGVTPKPPEQTGPLVKRLIPFMYWRKKRSDRKFFRRYEKEHRSRRDEIRDIQEAIPI